MTRKRPSSSAATMNIVLYATIVFITIAAIGSIYFAQTSLQGYVVTANQKKVDAEVNETNIQQSKKTEQLLESHKADIEHARAIVADTKQYAYQDDIVRDLTRYAYAAGVTITGFNFTTTTPTAGKSSSSGGLKTISAEIKLASPLPYKNYIQFLRYIENNRTKMIVSQLDIQANLKNTALVEASSISVEIFVR